MKRPGSFGFTLVELLVVLAILSIVAGVIITGFRNYYFYQSFNQSVGNAKATLVDTRVKARSSEGGTAHGVKFFDHSIVVFEGTSYSAINPNNETIEFAAVTITPELTGGTDEIIFSNLSGLPTATGTVELVGVSYLATTTIEITGTGVIQ